VYWTVDGRIRSVATSGGPVRDWPATHVAPWIAQDRSAIFYFSDNILFRSALGGGPPTQLAAPKSPARVAAGGAFVYFTSEGEFGTTDIARIDKSGGTPTTIVNKQPAVQGFAADDDGVYWTAGAREPVGSDQPPTSPTPTPAPTVAAVIQRGFVGFASGPTQSPTVLAKDRREVGEMAVDGGYAYWIEGTALMRAVKGGGMPSLVCAGKGHVSKPAFDANHIYIQLGDEVVSVTK
jgi:hypothetical protein